MRYRIKTLTELCNEFGEPSTHAAPLINIEPLKRESPSEVLKHIYKNLPLGSCFKTASEHRELVERIERALEGDNE